MTIAEISRVAFIGAGTMGCYNGLVAALAGYEAVIHDSDRRVLEAVHDSQQLTAGLLLEAGFCTPEQLESAWPRIRLEGDLAAAVRDVQLVSESVFEQIEVKREVLARLDALCAPRTIITSNSSMLLVSQMEDALERPWRFAALHTHLGSPLVDIVPASPTNPELLPVLERYVESLGGVPLLQRRENPGYVLNAMLGSLLTMALLFKVRGLASCEEVDRAWMAHADAPMGPFGMMDLFGLPLVLERWQDPEGDGHRSALQPAVLELLQGFVERGELGMKSGQGFYQYPGPAYRMPDFLQGAGQPEEIYDPLLISVIAAAIQVAAADVAEPQQIDMAWRVGIGLDWAPFERLQCMGKNQFARMLNQAVAEHRVDPVNADVVRDWLADNRGYGA